MRFSFSRVTVVVGCAVSLWGCPEKMTDPVHAIGPAPVVADAGQVQAAPTPTPNTAPPPTAGATPDADAGAAGSPPPGRVGPMAGGLAAVLDGGRAGAADAGAAGALDGGAGAVGDGGTAGAGADPALDGDLQKFAGFSRDESQFAFSVYSDGAGFYLVHIVEGRDGKMKERFILDSPDGLEAARKTLKARGFTSAQGTLPDRQRPTVKVVSGRVLVNVGNRVLYNANPFAGAGGGGAPQSAKLAHVSPSGKKIAVQVTQTPVTEFGGITTYLVLDAPTP